MRLIDREEARRKFSKELAYMGSDVDRILYNMKTIEAELVKHGRWEPTDMGGGEPDEAYVCSVCGNPWVLNAGTPEENDMNYCPNCGAKMDGEEE